MAACQVTKTPKTAEKPEKFSTVQKHFVGNLQEGTFFVLNTTKAQSALEKQTTCAILNLCQERKFEISECSDLHSDFFVIFGSF